MILELERPCDKSLPSSEVKYIVPGLLVPNLKPAPARIFSKKKCANNSVYVWQKGMLKLASGAHRNPEWRVTALGLKPSAAARPGGQGEKVRQRFSIVGACPLVRSRGNPSTVTGTGESIWSVYGQVRSSPATAAARSIPHHFSVEFSPNCHFPHQHSEFSPCFLSSLGGKYPTSSLYHWTKWMERTQLITWTQETVPDRCQPGARRSSSRAAARHSKSTAIHTDFFFLSKISSSQCESKFSRPS